MVPLAKERYTVIDNGAPAVLEEYTEFFKCFGMRLLKYMPLKLT